jgi:peptidoglycan/LPS O-acetylase OafA/YrhL
MKRLATAPVALVLALAAVGLFWAAELNGDVTWPFLPFASPFAAFYWLLAFGAFVCAAGALRRSRSPLALGAVLLILGSLGPSILLFYQCARGNCL